MTPGSQPPTAAKPLHRTAELASTSLRLGTDTHAEFELAAASLRQRDGARANSVPGVGHGGVVCLVGRW